MISPQFSIVIPTRNRADTLRYALQTCFEQDHDDYEIVVCDNSDDDATAALVREIAHPRVRYVKAPEALAMSANWELAVGSARGRYVTVLGDDDGLCTFALREAAALIARHGEVDAIHWARGIYTWPSLRVARWAHRLWGVNLTKTVARVDMRERLKLAAKLQAGADSLPMIYCSFINRELLQQLRTLTGQVFGHRIPDIYSGYVLGYLARDCLDLSFPLGIAGLSHNSNGMAQFYDPTAKAVFEDFNGLNARSGLVFHPQVPQEELLWTHIQDAYMTARDRLFRDDPLLELDLRGILRMHRDSIQPKPEWRRQRFTDAVRASIAHDAELLAWFDTLPAKEEMDEFELAPTQFGLQGTMISLNTSGVGVASIVDAVRLVGALLGDTGKPFDYPPIVVPEPMVEAPVVEPPAPPIEPSPPIESPPPRRTWLQRLGLAN